MANFLRNYPKLRAFVRLGRPKFLLYSMVLAALGPACAVWAGYPLNLTEYGKLQIFAWLAHLMTHYSNEYFDFEADLANAASTAWTGGSRVLVSGELPASWSLATAHVLLFAAVGVLSLFPTTVDRGLALLVLVGGWFYTAPPVRFNYLGVGELAVALSLNIAGPMLGYHLQTGEFSLVLFQALVPMAILQYVRMMVMNLSDVEGDRRAGKRTSIVRWGLKRAAWIFIVAQVLAYALVGLFFYFGSLPSLVAGAMLMTAPISMWLSRELWWVASSGKGLRAPGSTVFWASSHVALTFVGAMAGFLIAFQPKNEFAFVLFSSVLLVFLVSFAFQVKFNYGSKPL